MSDNIENALKEKGINLPKAAAPVASYVPAVEVNGLLYISGQVSMADGKLITGRLGENMSVEEGQKAAETCALMIAAQIKAHAGSLDRVERIVKLGAFVNSTAEFSDHPKVANGCSDMMEVIFGEAGIHARSAVGVSTPLVGRFNFEGMRSTNINQ